MSIDKSHSLGYPDFSDILQAYYRLWVKEINPRWNWSLLWVVRRYSNSLLCENWLYDQINQRLTYNLGGIDMVIKKKHILYIYKTQDRHGPWGNSEGNETKDNVKVDFNSTNTASFLRYEAKTELEINMAIHSMDVCYITFHVYLYILSLTDKKQGKKKSSFYYLKCLS